jgi:hypothetical protein
MGNMNEFITDITNRGPGSGNEDEVDPVKYHELARVTELFNRNLKRIFPSREWSVHAAPGGSLRANSTFNVSITFVKYDAVNNKVASKMNSDHRLELMAHLTTASGKFNKSARISFERMGHSRGGLKYRKISGKTLLDASNKLIKWLPKWEDKVFGLTQGIDEAKKLKDGDRFIWKDLKGSDIIGSGKTRNNQKPGEIISINHGTGLATVKFDHRPNKATVSTRGLFFEDAAATGTVQASVPTEGIPPIKRDASFGKSAVFDCDNATFAKCITGKKKNARWASHLGDDSPFYNKMKTWMGQSYKNKNFILRNKMTGEMVHARKLPESVNEEKDQWVLYDVKTKERKPNQRKTWATKKGAEQAMKKLRGSGETWKIASLLFYIDNIKESVNESAFGPDVKLSNSEDKAFQNAIKANFKNYTVSNKTPGNVQIAGNKLRTMQVEFKKRPHILKKGTWEYVVKTWDTAKPASRSGPVSQVLLTSPKDEDLKEINTLLKRLSQQKEFK